MNDKFDLVQRVNGFLSRLNLSPLNALGNDVFFTTLVAQEQTMFVYILPQADLFYLESPLMKLPATNLLALYQRLLELNNWETVEAYFSLVEKENQCEVLLQLMRPAEEIDFEEFQVALNVMLSVYKTYHPQLLADFGN